MGVHISVTLLAAWTAAQRCDLAVDLYSAVHNYLWLLSRQSNVVVAVLALTLAVLMFLTYKNYFSPRDQVARLQVSSRPSRTSRHDDAQSSKRSTTSRYARIFMYSDPECIYISSVALMILRGQE